MLLIEKEIVHLIKAKPFYAHFLQQMRRIETNKIKTLGVNITDGINLFINSEFFNKLKPKEKVACLEHEVLHILNKHLLRRENKDPEVFNIASDIAVNPYIENLPKGCLTPKQFNLETYKETEYYYDKLWEKSSKNKLLKFISSILDDHELWTCGNANHEYQEEIIRRAIQNTLEKTQDYGSLPSNVREIIKSALKYKSVNWRRVLQQFIYRATIVNTVLTRKRPNRRYEFVDGNRVECKLDLLIGLDTSGSIDSETLSLFFGEIEKIKALGMKIRVAECDTQIGRVYEYKHIPKNDITGGGGTNFKPVFELANTLKPNCIVYLTDGYGEYPDCSKIPTLWCISPDGDFSGNFGRHIKIT
jgi:predicted metal-dependent peptidase